MKASGHYAYAWWIWSRENTLVVFTSDNGGEIGVTTNACFRAASRRFEGGLREPWLCAGLHDQAGHRGDAHYHHRLLPDISRGWACALTGDRRLTASASCHSSKAPARSLLALPASFAFSRRPFLRAIRHGDFKLIEFYDTGKVSYNLRNDVGEQRDLAPAMPGGYRNCAGCYTHGASRNRLDAAPACITSALAIKATNAFQTVRKETLHNPVYCIYEHRLT